MRLGTPQSVGRHADLVGKGRRDHQPLHAQTGQLAEKGYRIVNGRVAVDCGVGGDAKPGCLGPTDAFQRTFCRAGQARECIVNLWRAIQMHIEIKARVRSELG